MSLPILATTGCLPLGSDQQPFCLPRIPKGTRPEFRETSCWAAITSVPNTSHKLAAMRKREQRKSKVDAKQDRNLQEQTG